MNRVLFLGPKPPPVSGYANIVVETFHCFNAHKLCVTLISTVPNKLAWLFPGLRWRILRAAYLMVLVPIVVILMPFHRVVYLNVNGEIGLLFDIVCAGIARLMGKSIYLHHHCFYYLYEHSRLLHWLIVAAGPKACHVMNGLEARERLMQLYSGAKRVRALSNAPILTYLNADKFDGRSGKVLSVGSDPNDNRLVCGYMAYFNKEKGLDTFCETVKALHDSGIDARGIAVGPVHDKVFVQSLQKEFSGIVDFRPPAYGDEAKRFFQEIDLLLFPSRYKNESEPLTIYLSVGAGVPVFATQMGCIRGILDELELCDSANGKEYVEEAVLFVQSNLGKLHDRDIRREVVKRSFENFSQRWMGEFKKFLCDLEEELTKKKVFKH